MVGNMTLFSSRNYYLSSLVALYFRIDRKMSGNSWKQNPVLHAHVLPATPIQPVALLVAVLTQMGDSVGISTNVQ